MTLFSVTAATAFTGGESGVSPENLQAPQVLILSIDLEASTSVEIQYQTL